MYFYCVKLYASNNQLKRHTTQNHFSMILILKRLPVWYKLSLVSYMPRGKILYNVKWHWLNVYWETSHTSSKCAHYGGNEKLTSLISVNKCWTLPAIWRIYPSHKAALISHIGAVWGLYNWSHPLHKWVNICSFSNSVWFGLGWERALLFRCASISWFQVVSKWVSDVFTASASTGFSDLF